MMQEKPDIEPEPIATEEKKTRIPPNERLIAFGIDFIVCYLFGVLTTLIPFLNHWLQLPTAVLLAFLARDYFFEGHGIGKNLLGLQVVDAVSKRPAKLSQSIARNFILIVPFLVSCLINLLTQAHVMPILDAATSNALYFVSMLYVMIVLPLESYRAYTRTDSLRKGDELAGTMVIESPMDFSHFLPVSTK
jgi:RDD family